jgi:hypothetical protein
MERAGKWSGERGRVGETKGAAGQRIGQVPARRPRTVFYFKAHAETRKSAENAEKKSNE